MSDDSNEKENDIYIEKIEEEKLFSVGHDGELYEIPFNKLTPEEFNNLLLWCVNRKVSEINLMPNEPVWCEFGGKKYRVTKRSITHPEIERIVQTVYADNGPAELIAGTPLDPAYEVKEEEIIEGKEKRKLLARWRFRINITSCQMVGGTGFQISIRTLPHTPIHIDKLGVEKEIIENIRPAQGMNIFAGPTGSGKSTLLSSIVRYICESPQYSEKVVEYSDPIEFVYHGLNFPNSFVTQTQVGKHIKTKIDGISNWAYAIVNALRRKPDIIIIGEARDKETIAECITGALSGHLVMTTMHTIGVPETIRRAIKAFPIAEQNAMAYDLLECLNLVVTQLLIPKKGGGKVACKEYMLFDRKAKSALNGHSPDVWPEIIRDIMNTKQALGQTFSQCARQLLNEDKITPETYEWIASRTSNESKIIRDAIALGYLDNEESETYE